MEIKKKRISKIDDLTEFETDWKMIENGNDMTVFQSFDWNRLLTEEFLQDRYNKLFSALYVFAVYRDKACKMIAPVIVQKVTAKIVWWGKRKGIYILGTGSYSDYLNFIYDDFAYEAFEGLIAFIKNEFNGLQIHMTYLREDTMMSKYLKSTGKEKLKQTTSVYVSLEKNGEEYYNSLSKNVRQNLRTAKNRMKKDGIRYEIKILRRIEDLDRLDGLMSLHAKRVAIKNRKVDTDPLHKLSGILMYRYMEKKEQRYNIVQRSMCTMKDSIEIIVELNGHISGYLYGLLDKKAIRVMQNCFDEDYRYYSPMFRGSFDFISQECDERNLKVDQIDFTRGGEDYKFKLGGKELRLDHYML